MGLNVCRSIAMDETAYLVGSGKPSSSLFALAMMPFNVAIYGLKVIWLNLDNRHNDKNAAVSII